VKKKGVERDQFFIVEGRQELQDNLARLALNIQSKILDKAFKNVLDEVWRRYAATVPQETGAAASMDAAANVYKGRTKRKWKGSHTYGRTLQLWPQYMISARRAMGGRIGKDFQRSEDFKYLYFLEFGDDDTPPGRYLYNALGGKADAMRSATLNAIQQAIREL
jgi:hypothetical protein